MARHAISADKAFDMLRDHSQNNGRKLTDVAEAVVETTSSCCRRWCSLPSRRRRAETAVPPGLSQLVSSVCASSFSCSAASF